MTAATDAALALELDTMAARLHELYGDHRPGHDRARALEAARHHVDKARDLFAAAAFLEAHHPASQ